MINSTLCYIEKDGCYLMLYRNKKARDMNEGKWIGVGGKFEPGETGDDCVKREVLEETGLLLTSFYFHGIIAFENDRYETEMMHLYSADGFTGTVTENCDEGELHWIPKEKILSLPTWEGDPYFLKKLLAGEKQINMRLIYENDKLVKVIGE